MSRSLVFPGYSKANHTLVNPLRETRVYGSSNDRQHARVRDRDHEPEMRRRSSLERSHSQPTKNQGVKIEEGHQGRRTIGPTSTAMIGVTLIRLVMSSVMRIMMSDAAMRKAAVVIVLEPHQ